MGRRLISNGDFTRAEVVGAIARYEAPGGFEDLVEDWRQDREGKDDDCPTCCTDCPRGLE